MFRFIVIITFIFEPTISSLDNYKKLVNFYLIQLRPLAKRGNMLSETCFRICFLVLPCLSCRAELRNVSAV